VQGFFSKNVITLKIHIFLFQLKAFQLKEKISLTPGEGLPAAIPSAFIFVRVFVAYALAAHCNAEASQRAALSLLYKNARQK